MEPSSPKKTQLPLLSLAPSATRKEKYSKARHFHFTTVKDSLTRSTQITKTTLNAKKTTKDLHSLPSISSSNQPNQLLTSAELEAIKISSKAFTSVINNCFAYKNELIEIKRQYDNYLDELLRSMEVHAAAASTSSDYYEGVINEDITDIRSVKDSVLSLSEEIVFHASENERLQQEWISCQRESRDVDQSQDVIHDNDEQKDYAFTVNQKQYQLYSKHEDIRSSMESRSGLVPSTVCQRLEQCIRSNELELQKLLKNNKRLQEEIQRIESKLQQYLVTVKSPSDSVMGLWKLLEENAKSFIELGQSTH